MLCHRKKLNFAAKYNLIIVYQSIMSEQKTTKAPSVSDDEILGSSKFDRRRRLIGAICAPICALLVFITPIDGLTPEAHKLLSIIRSDPKCIEFLARTTKRIAPLRKIQFLEIFRPQNLRSVWTLKLRHLIKIRQKIFSHKAHFMPKLFKPFT